MWKWLKRNYKTLTTVACGAAGVAAMVVPGAQVVGVVAAIACPAILGAGKAAEVSKAANAAGEVVKSVRRAAKK